MKDLWQIFLLDFCKVDAVCSQGEPNGLGWMLIIILGFLILFAAIGMFAYFAEQIEALPDYPPKELGKEPKNNENVPWYKSDPWFRDRD